MLYRIWAKKNSRPEVIKQNGFKSCYLFGAVNPRTGQHIGLVFSTMDSDVFNIHLKLIGESLAADVHAILILDNAGFHKAKTLEIPENITLWYLPPYSPQLNPVERLWFWLKKHFLGNRKFSGMKEMISIGCQSWLKLCKRVIKSVCRTSWLFRTKLG